MYQLMAQIAEIADKFEPQLYNLATHIDKLLGNGGPNCQGIPELPECVKDKQVLVGLTCFTPFIVLVLGYVAYSYLTRNRE